MTGNSIKGAVQVAGHNVHCAELSGSGLEATGTREQWEMVHASV